MAILLLSAWAALAAAHGVTVNINTASQDKIAQLPGIGPVKAQAIVMYRASHGRFAKMSSLLKIKGIGPATLDKIRDHIVFSAPPPEFVANPETAPVVHNP